MFRSGDKIIYPDPDWLREQPDRFGISEERSRRFHQFLKQNGGEDWIAIIIKSGSLIFEGCGPSAYPKQWRDFGSILKPLQATVLGAALLQGKLKSLDEDALPYWKEAYQTSFENDRRISFRQFAHFKDCWNRPEAPGTYYYNNSGATAAGECIAGLFTDVRGSKSKKISEIAKKEVMEKIGAQWHLWHWDLDFDPVNSGNPGPRMVLESDVYELAKLGYLWLRQGQWGEQRIFSKQYYREAVTDGSPQTNNRNSNFAGHYGYWWFVNQEQMLFPDIPADAFYHTGNGNPQWASILLVIPSQETVAVMSMRRISDLGQWDVISNARGVNPDGPRRFAKAVVDLVHPE